jgi:hypothetical protein
MESEVANRLGRLLVRVMIGKVEDRKRLRTLLEAVPIPQDDPNWNCVSWIRDALELIARDGRCLGKASATDWKTVESFVTDYLNSKVSGGRFTEEGLRPGVPTWDLAGNVELIE